jgi:hypothetical protein
VGYKLDRANLLEQANPERNSDTMPASASTNPTPPRDGVLPEPMADAKQLTVPQAIKSERDMGSLKKGPIGPRSEAGKQRSSRNAFKSGIFAKVVVIPGESSAQYRSLLQKFREDWQPVGASEEFLVETITNIIWRLRRLYAAESAEIRRGREFVEWDERNRQAEEAEELGTHAGDASYLIDSESGLIHKIRNPVIVGRCLELLLELQRTIKTGDRDHEKVTAILQTLHGANDRLRSTLCQSYLEWSKIAMPEKNSQR